MTCLDDSQLNAIIQDLETVLHSPDFPENGTAMLLIHRIAWFKALKENRGGTDGQCIKSAI